MTTLTLAEAARLVNGELSGGDVCFQTVSTDTRTLRPGELFIALKGPHFDGHDFVAVAREKGACGALVDRTLAVDLPQLRVADTRLALGRLSAAWRQRFTGMLLALTGSNGKTTVKEMLAAILRSRGEVLATAGNLNNDIGMPLTLLRLREDHRYAVIEMGANRAGEIAYLTALARPDVAILTNAGPAHLEGFGDLDGVARAKGEIFEGLSLDGVAVINRDDPYADYWCGRVQGRRILGFTLEGRAEVCGRVLDEACNRFQLIVAGQEVAIKLPLPGRHNVRNALAAAAAAWAVGVNLEDIGRGLEGVPPVVGRLQSLPGRFGVTVIDDTYNANPASLEAALTAIAEVAEVRWLVLGDMAELGSSAAALHKQAGQQARVAGFQRLYALGRHSLQAARAFGVGGVHFETVAALRQALIDAIHQAADKPHILIKGSRSMRMERIVQMLAAGPGNTNKGESWQDPSAITGAQP